MAIGSLPEKVSSAFQSVTNEDGNEEAALNKCRTAVSNVRIIREEDGSGSTPGENSTQVACSSLFIFFAVFLIEVSNYSCCH